MKIRLSFDTATETITDLCVHRIILQAHRDDMVNSFSLVQNKSQFHALRTCPVPAANVRNNLLPKITFLDFLR